MRTARHFMAAAALLISGIVSLQGAETPPTFAADVAPIVFSSCAGCHHAGGDAPFSLTSYDEVRRRASLIAAATERRYMPPWKPEPGFGDFTGSRRLTDAQLDTIRRWVAAGAPEGDPHKVPPLPDWQGGWMHGTPDLVLELPTYTLRADGDDVFRNFVVQVPGTARRFVRGLQFRPGNLAVHHANIRVDPTPASRALDDADPDAGYEGLILHSADYPDGHFLGWTPGQAPPVDDADLSWRLDGGSDFVVQLHLRPTGRSESIHPSIGLYFADHAPAHTPSILRLGRQNLDIPPETPRYQVTDSFVLPVDAEVRAVQPHAHYRATTVDAWATLPNGTRRPLIRIAAWDLNWQDQYRYASPFWLPKGTTLSMTYTFDNSSANPRNPDHPAGRVRWGWRSSDEMADVWLQVFTRSAADRTLLQSRIDAKMLAEDAIGCEVLLERQPNLVSLRNDTALIYMRLGRPILALPHFEAVSRLEPQSAAAWFNEGVALEALGRATDASTRYARAVQLKPDYAAARVNLGSLFVRAGRLDDARREYAAAIAADRRNADAHANLALVMLGQRQPDAALTELDVALTLDAARVRQLSPFIWLLVAHHDADVRRIPQGRALAERMVSASDRRDASALDALAAAYAASHAFDRATQTASDALRLVPADSPLARDIQARLDLYQRGLTFVLAE
ncbi:MAG: tetratricopeptide repeat protein [Vicinamibacterales bacterium]